MLKLNAQRASRAHELVQGIIYDSGTSSPSAPLPIVAPKKGDILDASKTLTPLPAIASSNNDSDDDKPLGDILAKDQATSSAKDDDNQPLRLRP